MLSACTPHFFKCWLGKDRDRYHPCMKRWQVKQLSCRHGNNKDLWYYTVYPWTLKKWHAEVVAPWKANLQNLCLTSPANNSAPNSAASPKASVT